MFIMTFVLCIVVVTILLGRINPERLKECTFEESYKLGDLSFLSIRPSGEAPEIKRRPYREPLEEDACDLEIIL